MKLLYCIDERGLKGGAHIATELLISALREKGHQVDVMEAIRRNSFWGYCQRAYLRVFPRRSLPLFLRDPWGVRRRKMRSYETVCVMSETSTFTALVATLPARVRKVQMIHTHYPRWAVLVKRDIAADERLFKKMDCIAAVGVIGARDLAELMPSCRDKIVPFHNLINQEGLVYREKKLLDGPVRIISLARINDKVAKDGPRMVRIAHRLKAAGLHFIWDNYGGSGNGFAACQKEIDRLGIGDVFRIHSYDPQARVKIAAADLFVLPSHYEGLPNVIYESLLSGTPVLATKVGGIPEQIEEGKTGWLVDDDEDAIGVKLESLILHKEFVYESNRYLKSFAFDNDLIVSEQESLLNKWRVDYGCVEI